MNGPSYTRNSKKKIGRKLREKKYCRFIVNKQVNRSSFLHTNMLSIKLWLTGGPVQKYSNNRRKKSFVHICAVLVKQRYKQTMWTIENSKEIWPLNVLNTRPSVLKLPPYQWWRIPSWCATNEHQLSATSEETLEQTGRFAFDPTYFFSYTSTEKKGNWKMQYNADKETEWDSFVFQTKVFWSEGQQM